MVNHLIHTAVKLFCLLLLTVPVFAQTDLARERRLAELERRIVLLDPGFSQTSGSDFDLRLLAAERKIEQLLSSGGSQKAIIETPPSSPSTVVPLALAPTGFVGFW